MKSKVTIGVLCVLFAGTGLMTGCATTQVERVSARAKTKFVVRYQNSEFEPSLARVGLSATVLAYWQSHFEKNWGQLYDYEILPNNLEKKFYEAYHAKAFDLLSVQVDGLELTNLEANLQLTLTFFDAGKQENLVQQLKDTWLWKGGTWRHLARDPMLVGFES